MSRSDDSLHVHYYELLQLVGRATEERGGKLRRRIARATVARDDRALATLGMNRAVGVLHVAAAVGRVVARDRRAAHAAGAVVDGGGAHAPVVELLREAAHRRADATVGRVGRLVIAPAAVEHLDHV